MAAAGPVMGRYNPTLISAAAGTAKKRQRAVITTNLFRKEG
jgi:hypothetical protein